MNEKEFIKFVKQECKKYGIKCELKNTKTINFGENSRCSGYFDGGSLVVAMKRPDAMQILVHEYGHLTQWAEQCDLWVQCEKSKSHDKLWKWLNGKRVRSIQNAVELCRDLELDNEKRSVKLIKKFNLNIDTDLYIKKANAYVQFYNYLAVSRKWCKPSNSPYKNKRLLKLMPDKFNMNYKKLSKKVLKVFIEENI